MDALSDRRLKTIKHGTATKNGTLRKRRTRSESGGAGDDLTISAKDL
jgi:hypothetical protein